MSAPTEVVIWAEELLGEQAETLREYGSPVETGGDADWLEAVFVYVIDEPLTGEGVTVPAGTYIRTVEGRHERAWQVDGLWAARAYAQTVEAAYLHDQG